MSDISRTPGWRSAALIGLISGIVSGAAAGWLSANLSIVPKMSDFERMWQERIASVPATSTTSSATASPEIVPLDSARPPLPVYPSLFLNRRFSPVLTILKRATPRTDGLASTDRIIGYGVSLTSDGWLVMPTSVLTNTSRADLSVSWKGRLYPVTKGMVDSGLEVAFLKIDATGLPVTGFVRANDVTAGTQVWVESASGEISGETVLRTDGRINALDPLSSERPSRRFVIAARDSVSKSGGAVWSDAGDLVGLITDHSKGMLQILPGSVLSSVLSQALNNKEIRRASLDVRTLDLAHVIFEDSKIALPLQGAWVRGVSTNGVAKMSLKEGDVIERIERDVFDGNVDLGERLLDYRPGSTVTIAGTREGKPFEVSLKLGSTSTSELLK